MGKRGPKPKGMVSTEWSPNLAYAVGLLVADGCLLNDGRHLDFTSKDKEQIETFRKCLNLSVKIGKKMSGGKIKRWHFRMQFGDVLFYQWLMGVGLTPHKSKTIAVLNVPDHFFFDFLRGCYDGDGSMYAYWDPRWRSSYMFYLQITSASIPFLKWLQQSIFRLACVHGRIGRAGRAYQLRYAKKETLALFDKMYYAGDIPFLKRKFAKAAKIFKINKQQCPGGEIGTRTTLRW